MEEKNRETKEMWVSTQSVSWDRHIPDTYRSPYNGNVALIDSRVDESDDMHCETCDF